MGENILESAIRGIRLPIRLLALVENGHNHFWQLKKFMQPMRRLNMHSRGAQFFLLGLRWRGEDVFLGRVPNVFSMCSTPK
jgi:hypothetical protein